MGAAHDLGRRQPDRRHRGGHPGQPDKDRQLHDRERARRPRRILEAFRINSIDPNIGGGTALVFTAISAAVIGGTALAGGSGTVIGALLGALILAELQNGFNLIGISANPFNLILGSAILISMIANQYLSRLRRTGGA